MPKTFLGIKMETWFEEELKTYMKVHNLDNKTEAIHRIFKELLDLKKPKLTKESSPFLLGTKAKCLSRNEYLDLYELPCVSSNFNCMNNECFQRIQKIFENLRVKPKEIHGLHQ